MWLPHIEIRLNLGWTAIESRKLPSINLEEPSLTGHQSYLSHAEFDGVYVFVCACACHQYCVWVSRRRRKERQMVIWFRASSWRQGNVQFNQVETCCRAQLQSLRSTFPCVVILPGFGLQHAHGVHTWLQISLIKRTGKAEVTPAATESQDIKSIIKKQSATCVSRWTCTKF